MFSHFGKKFGYLATASTLSAATVRSLSTVASSSSSDTPSKGANLLLQPTTPNIYTPAQSNEQQPTQQDSKDSNESKPSDAKNPYLLPRVSETDINYKPYSIDINPPVARQRPTVSILPWDTRVDNYAWLRDTESPETINYLECENEYTQQKMSHTNALQTTLTKEMIARIVETDQSVPSKKGNWYYYSREEKGKNYKIYCRSKKVGDREIKPEMLPIKDEMILLDVNEEAKDKKYMSVGTFKVSNNHNLLAYSTDDQGNEVYNLKFKDFTTNEMLKDEIPDIAGSVVWLNDDNSIFYTKNDDAWREYQVWCHKLGEPIENDVLIYEEPDNKFSVSVSKTRSDDYILLHCGSNTTDEVYYLNANKATFDDLKERKLDLFNCVAKREQNVEYTVHHHRNAQRENYFYILHNGDYNGSKCQNFQLFRRPVSNTSIPGRAVTQKDWELIIPHRDDTTLQDIDCFEKFVVISQRKDGLPQFRVNYDFAGNSDKEHVIAMPETVYDIWNGNNFEYNTNKFRFQYTSMITPMTTYDYYVNTTKFGRVTNETTLIPIKQRPVEQYESNNYVTWREWATARDGTQIPITLLANKEVADSLQNNSDSSNVPTVLVGYGSYGYPYPIYFSAARLTLVDRGVLFCYAHIRGGGEFGRMWKLDGKLQHKRNSFTDFIECSDYLQNVAKYTDNTRFGVSGGSAGGLLMGACMNMRPDLFKFMILDVPFVDVLNTILDETIPLTAQEWEEWGDPRTMNDYFYIKSYSPYDNVQPMVLYPNLLVLAGLNDPRVKYWEPTKLTCKLREIYRTYGELYKETYGNDKPNLLLLKTNMGAGHHGASGRYDKYKELSFEYAFILDQLGLKNKENKYIDISKVEIPDN